MPRLCAEGPRNWAPTHPTHAAADPAAIRGVCCALAPCEPPHAVPRPPPPSRSIVGENIPILTGEEKYNETVTSSVKRVVAKLTGKEDPGPPFR